MTKHSKQLWYIGILLGWIQVLDKDNYMPQKNIMFFFWAIHYKMLQEINFEVIW